MKQSTRIRHKSTRKGPHRRHKSPGLALGRNFQADVRREARSLGLSTDEYLRLLVAMSKSLRQGLLTNRKVDAKALLELAESPVFGAMIQYVAQGAGNFVKSGDTEASEPDTSSQAPSLRQEPAQPRPFGQHIPWQGGQQPGMSQPNAPAPNPPRERPQVQPWPRQPWPQAPWQPPSRPQPMVPQAPAPSARSADSAPSQASTHARRRVVPLPVQFYS